MPEGVIYPQGCRPIQEELGADELIRRLKVGSTYRLVSQLVYLTPAAKTVSSVSDIGSYSSSNGAG